MALYCVQSVSNELTEIVIIFPGFPKEVIRKKQFHTTAHINRENVTRVCRVEYTEEKIMPLLF